MRTSALGVPGGDLLECLRVASIRSRLCGRRAAPPTGPRGAWPSRRRSGRRCRGRGPASSGRVVDARVARLVDGDPYGGRPSAVGPSRPARARAVRVTTYLLAARRATNPVWILRPDPLLRPDRRDLRHDGGSPKDRARTDTCGARAGRSPCRVLRVRVGLDFDTPIRSNGADCNGGWRL